MSTIQISARCRFFPSPFIFRAFAYFLCSTLRCFHIFIHIFFRKSFLLSFSFIFFPLGCLFSCPSRLRPLWGCVGLYVPALPSSTGLCLFPRLISTYLVDTRCVSLLYSITFLCCVSSPCDCQHLLVYLPNHVPFEATSNGHTSQLLFKVET